MEQITDFLKTAKREGRRVYIIGNGGSYANAMHIQNDLIGAGVRAFTLDPSTLTAIGNDFGYENVFSRWLSVVGDPGDILIALSGSGTSKNIVAAMVMADNIGMKHYLVTDYLRSMDMQRSEENQIEVGHEWMRELRCVP